MNVAQFAPGEQVLSHIAGEKSYELVNHLGNVLSVVSDKKVYDRDWQADLQSSQDYYAFGMQMPGRSYNSEAYRFGFNGKENDNEVKGTGNSVDFGARIHDPRLGRFLSLDPDVYSYPFMSPYTFAGNNPISFIDKNGKGPEKPFSAYQRGDFYFVGIQTTDQRKTANISQSLYMAAGGALGSAAEITIGLFDQNRTNQANVKIIRDYSTEFVENVAGYGDTKALSNLSRFAGVLGNIATAYDIISEANSPPTRAERLGELTIFVAQLELSGERSPSGVSDYLSIPASQFKSAEDASNVLNGIYKGLDQAFKLIDITNDDNFKMVKETLSQNTGVGIAKSVQDAQKED